MNLQRSCAVASQKKYANFLALGTWHSCHKNKREFWLAWTEWNFFFKLNAKQTLEIIYVVYNPTNQTDSI